MDSIQRDAGLDGIYVAGAELTKLEISRDDGTLAVAANPAVSATHLRLPASVFPAIDRRSQPLIPVRRTRNISADIVISPHGDFPVVAE
jgi:hypothetical protein